MTTETTKTTGRAFYAGQTPMAEAGTPITTKCKTAKEATKLAGLDWEVAVGPLYGGPDRRHIKAVPGRYATYRTDTGAVLGVVSARYQPGQNAEACNLLDPFAKDGTLEYVAGGELLGGRVVWLQAKLADTLEIAGDTYAQYILVTTRHDAIGKVRCLPIDERLWCSNMINWAIAAGGSAGVAVSHDPQYERKMADALETLEETRKQNKQLAAYLERAAHKKVTNETIRLLTVTMFGEVEDDEGGQRRNAIDKFDEMLHAECARSGGTAYALINAVTGYADHAFRYNGDETKQAQSRFLAITAGGTAAKFKAKGIAEIAKLAGIA